MLGAKTRMALLAAATPYALLEAHIRPPHNPPQPSVYLAHMAILGGRSVARPRLGHPPVAASVTFLGGSHAHGFLGQVPHARRHQRDPMCQRDDAAYNPRDVHKVRE
eukprot:scaffold170310_cov28-Tisochrysis_lutea.AAC.4